MLTPPGSVGADCAAMPSRHRPKQHTPTPSAPAGAAPRSQSARPVTDVERDLERFAAALKESEQRDRADRQKAQQAKDDSTRRAADAAAHADDLRQARRALERAVEAVRTAKQQGRGRPEADEAWKAAKARVIELETGERPAWAPKPAEVEEPATESSTDEPVTDDTVTDDAAADD